MVSVENEARLPERLSFVAVLAVLLAIILPPIGLVLGLALRYDYRERPRNRRVATGAVWLAVVLIALGLAAALLAPIMSLSVPMGVR